MNKKVWSSVAVAAFFVVAFASMFIGSMGCDPVAERARNEAKSQWNPRVHDFGSATSNPMEFNNGFSMYEVTFAGHLYTVATYNCKGCSVVHSPNCPCLKPKDQYPWMLNSKAVANKGGGADGETIVPLPNSVTGETPEDLIRGCGTWEVYGEVNLPKDATLPHTIEIFDGHGRTILERSKDEPGCYYPKGYKPNGAANEPKVIDEVK